MKLFTGIVYFYESSNTTIIFLKNDIPYHTSFNISGELCVYIQLKVKYSVKHSIFLLHIISDTNKVNLTLV